MRASLSSPTNEAAGSPPPRTYSLRPILAITAKMTSDATPSAMPTQKIGMLIGSSIRATPPTTNPSMATETAVQAAGVLPWWEAMRAPASARR